MIFFWGGAGSLLQFPSLSEGIARYYAENTFAVFKCGCHAPPNVSSRMPASVKFPDLSRAIQRGIQGLGKSDCMCCLFFLKIGPLFKPPLTLATYYLFLFIPAPPPPPLPQLLFQNRHERCFSCSQPVPSIFHAAWFKPGARQ